MEKAIELKPDKPADEGDGKRGSTKSKLTIHEEKTVKAAAPAGSRFKGYTSFVVQDLVVRPHVTNFRCERWQTPDGKVVTASCPYYAPRDALIPWTPLMVIWEGPMRIGLSLASASPAVRSLFANQGYAAILEGRLSASRVLFLVVCATIANCDDYDEIVDWGNANLAFLRGFAAASGAR